MKYWLMKTEPSEYSIDDLERDRVGMWDKVRNYQARNFLRDEVSVGDLVLFYHSGIPSPEVTGIAKVVKEAYPDPTQFDEKSSGYDPKSLPQRPRWVAIDISFVKKFKTALSLFELKNDPAFADMIVVRRGVRLSVQPVHKKDFLRAEKLGSA